MVNNLYSIAVWNEHQLMRADHCQPGAPTNKNKQIKVYIPPAKQKGELLG